MIKKENLFKRLRKLCKRMRSKIKRKYKRIQVLRLKWLLNLGDEEEKEVNQSKLQLHQELKNKNGINKPIKVLAQQVFPNKILNS